MAEQNDDEVRAGSARSARRPRTSDDVLFTSATELHRFELLVQHSGDIITVLSEDGSWKYTSPSGSRLLGYPRGFDPEGGIMALVHPEDVATAMNALADVLDGSRGPDDPVQFRVLHADGSPRRLESVGLNLLADPSIRGVVITSRIID